MMRRTSFAVIAAAGIALAGCQAAQDLTDAATGEVEAAACNASAPRAEKAWINKQPGPNDNPTLHAKMLVDAPTPGYTYTMTPRDGAPSNEGIYILELTGTAPEGIALQVVTETYVSYQEGTFAPESLRAVQVLCDGVGFALISPVDIIQ